MMRFALSAACLAAALLASAPASSEPMRISVSVPGPGNTAYLPVELITRIGADRAEGAAVKVHFVPGGGQALQQLTSRNVDFAVVGLPAAMHLRARDPRIVALAAMNNVSLYALIVRSGLKDTVKSPADLRGRTVGVHSSSLSVKTNSHQLAELLVKLAGISPGEVRFVAAGQTWDSHLAALESGFADAIMASEPFASRLVADGKAFVLVNLGDPATAARIPGGAFLRATLIATTDLVQREPEKAERMVRIVRRVLEWIAASAPDKIVEALAIPDPQARAHMRTVLARYPRQFSADGSFSTRQLKDTEIFYRAAAADASEANVSVESMVIDRWAGRRE